MEVEGVLLAGVAIAAEPLFLLGSPELGGTEGLLADDRLSGVAVRLLDLLRIVLRSESFEPLACLLGKGDRLL